MKRLLFVAFAAVLASAQAPADPVMTNYRAYRAALEAGDLATAETSARAAWEASSARDTSGNRTGALALNYAKVALANGHREAAYQPAQQAFTIAQAGGLDPVQARLALGRAELARGEGEEGVARLQAALTEAQNRAEIGPDAYEAASDLGSWALSQQNYELAASGFGQAAGYAGFAPGDHELALGQARIAEAVALYTFAMRAENDDRRAGLGQTGSYVRATNQSGTYARAQASLVAAEEALYPLASQQPASDDGLTRAQRDYATAYAWRMIIQVRLRSNDQNRLPEPDLALRMRLDGSGPICPMRLVAEPEPVYPSSAAHQQQYGAVVTRFLFTEGGDVRDVRVAAGMPEVFQAPVERVAPRWRVERGPGAPANCQVPPVMFFGYMFYIE